MTELIYSGTKVRGRDGRKVLNPKFFTVPVEGVKTVYLNGDHPKIKAAYEEKGVKVLPLHEMPKPKKAATAAEKGA